MNNKFWWSFDDFPIEGKNVHENVWPAVRKVEERQVTIHRQNLINAKLYSNRELQALDWNSNSLRDVSYAPVTNTMENLLASGVDSVTAMLGRQQPKVTPVVDDADFTLERESRKLDRYLFAEFNHQDVYTKMQRAFNDCLWAQIGALRVDIDGDEIFVERVMPDEIIVDQRECVGDMNPLQMHHRKVVPKVVLMNKYPKLAHDIEKVTNKYVSYRSPGPENVVVIESWFLPNNGKPGRHTITCETCTIVDEEYKRDKFPFVFLRWIVLPTGFYGRSLVEYGMPYQLRQNELNRVIQLAQDLMCIPRILVPGGAQIIKTTVDNSIARFIHTRGGEPKAITWPAVAADLYNERERNRRIFFEDIGLSTLFAQASPPDGVRFDSSRALREFNFRENERFQRQAQMLENAYLLLGEHLIELNVILAKRGINRKLKWNDRNLVGEIAWDEFDIPANKYSLRLAASSIQNMTPAARDEQVNEWTAKGWVTPEEAKALSNHPDLTEQKDLFSASVDNIKSVCSKLDQGEVPQIDPLQNLTYGVVFVHSTYLKRVDQFNVPEEVLQAYRDWLVEAKFQLEQSNAEQQMLQDMLQAQMAPQTGPEGNILPAEATTAQGVPTRSF